MIKIVCAKEKKNDTHYLKWNLHEKIGLAPYEKWTISMVDSALYHNIQTSNKQTWRNELEQVKLIDSRRELDEHEHKQKLQSRSNDGRM